jgi:hypothetical protein
VAAWKSDPGACSAVRRRKNTQQSMTLDSRGEAIQFAIKIGGSVLFTQSAALTNFCERPDW